MLQTQSSWWLGFNLFVLLMLAVDLGLFHRKAHVVTVKEAVIWSCVWICMALFFALGLGILRGHEMAATFVAGYLIEKSLSVDNIFIFLALFGYFRIPPQFQHKVLFWGIIGALVTRAGFIFAGVALIQRFHWVTYVFGAFLIYTAIKMVRHHGATVDPAANPLIRLIRKVIPVTDELHGGRFILLERGRLVATPLFVALLVIELSDVLFAVDSIPAVLAITDDQFIVYTSNVFAILGLRSLYFAVAGAVKSFAYLHFGLAAILGFVGVKMLAADVWHIPTTWALGMIALLLSAAVLASLWAARQAPKQG